MALDVKLVIDGKQIPLNEFVKKVFTGMIVGAIMSLRGIQEDWRKIHIEIAKQE